MSDIQDDVIINITKYELAKYRLLLDVVRDPNKDLFVTSALISLCEMNYRNIYKRATERDGYLTSQLPSKKMIGLVRDLTEALSRNCPDDEAKLIKKANELLKQYEVTKEYG